MQEDIQSTMTNEQLSMRKADCRLRYKLWRAREVWRQNSEVGNQENRLLESFIFLIFQGTWPIKAIIVFFTHKSYLELDMTDLIVQLPESAFAALRKDPA